jgi:hypothetical protein
MGVKSDRLLERLFKIPLPKDFTWDDLISVMDAANFSNNCEGGSHYAFEHKSGFQIHVSKTHPSGILKRYQINDVKDALQSVGEYSSGD